MVVVVNQDVPPGRLIADYAERAGHFTDCYSCVVSGQVTLADYVAAFYTSPLFRAERFVLRVAARAPSTDAQARAVADGQSERFAIWTVETRRQTELMMAERSGRTKSWFMVSGQGSDTRLLFGTVVVPVRSKSGDLVLGPVFDSLKGAHTIYARALLAAAARRVLR